MVKQHREVLKEDLKVLEVRLGPAQLQVNRAAVLKKLQRKQDNHLRMLASLTPGAALGVDETMTGSHRVLRRMSQD